MIDQVIVTAVEDVLVVAKIIKAVGHQNMTSLEWQTLPASLMGDFTVGMGFGWLLMANVLPGAELSMPTQLVSMMLPF